jgi:hypothetical protein
MPDATSKFAGFADIVRSEDEIWAVMGRPKPGVLAKEADRLDELARAFIARAPFVLVASAGADGHLDVSPKGDPAGFVRVLDDKHLAIPDRLGNRRIDTFRNLLANPRVGLIFLIPGKTETLRIGGEARIVRDEPLRRAMAVAGRAPDFALVVWVERLFMHCPKCMLRSRLWEPAAWPDATGAPSLAETSAKYGNLGPTAAEIQVLVDRDARERLY